MSNRTLRVHMSVLAAFTVVAALPLVAHGASPGSTGALAWVHAPADADPAAPHDIWISGADGPRALVTDPGNDLDPVFRPTDRGLIAYAGRGPANGDRDIRLVRTDGSGRAVLVERPGNDRWPSWSPDGKQLVFNGATGEDTGTYDVYVVNADGSGLARLIGGDGNQLYPSWSPKGDKIVYEGPANVPAKNKGQEPTTTTAVFTYELATGRVTQLTAAARAAETPSWSPDGSRIVFTGRRDKGQGTDEVFTIRADGTDERPVGAFGSWPDFTPDGSRIVFAAHNGATDGNDIRSVGIGTDGTVVSGTGRWEVALPGGDNIPRYQAVTSTNSPMPTSTPTPTATATATATPTVTPTCLLGVVCP
jgi:Tol biopolymer transport system component